MPKRNVYTPTRAQRLRGESQVNDCTLWELLDEVLDRTHLTNGLEFCTKRQVMAVMRELNKRHNFHLPKNHPGNE